jgi:NAD(P)-dependent dehydrogenase (short-subunit alcohol dehydrogenase family)
MFCQLYQCIAAAKGSLSVGRYMNSTADIMISAMNERIALVTGANKGLGKEISRQLAAKDVLVVMTARNQERGEKAMADLRAAGLAVEFIQMDVTSQPSVDAAAAELERRHGRLDILVNNAGIAIDWYGSPELILRLCRGPSKQMCSASFVSRTPCCRF